MAYISTEEVKKIRQTIRKEFSSKNGWKISIKRLHHSTVAVTILESYLNLDPEKKGYYQINEFWIDSHYENQRILKTIFSKIRDIILNVKSHSNPNAGDPSADYPDWNYHMDIAVGKWDKPFVQVYRYNHK